MLYPLNFPTTELDRSLMTAFFSEISLLIRKLSKTNHVYLINH